MKSQQQQIDELKAAVDRLTREIARMDTRNAHVKMPRMGLVLGKTDATHNKGASGTVSVWGGTPLSEADTSLDITAYNKFANVGSGKWVICAYIRRAWYIISAEC